MIGIATTVFWIFLVGFAVTAAYSVKDLEMSFGEPKVTLTSDDRLLVSMPVYVLNRGYYEIDQLAIRTEICDSGGVIVADGTTSIPNVPKDHPINSTHTVMLETATLLGQNDSLLFNDSELLMNAAIGMTLAHLIPVEASTNFSIPWGAPLYDFTVGDPMFSPWNSSHCQILFQVRFSNHAFYDLSGSINARLVDDANTLVSEGETIFSLPSGSEFDQGISMILPLSETVSRGYLEVSLETPIFNYGPLVIPFG